MTGGTIRAVAPFMNIVICMTGAAVFLFLLLLGHRACMAGDAFNFSMASVKLKTRIPIVVESVLLLPTGGCVALLTLGPEPTAVSVVQAMTVITFFGRLLIALTNVALRA